MSRPTMFIIMEKYEKYSGAMVSSKKERKRKGICNLIWNCDDKPQLLELYDIIMSVEFLLHFCQL